MPSPRAFQCSRAMGAVMGHGLCSQGLVSCPGACLPVLTAPWPRVVPGGPQSPSSALGRGGLPASLCSAFQCPRHQLQGTHISHTAPKPRHHRWAVRYINKLRLSQEEQSSLFFLSPAPLRTSQRCSGVKCRPRGSAQEFSGNMQLQNKG